MKYHKACFDFYFRAQKLIAPSLRYSQAIYEEILFSYSNNIGNWLDLGCGHQLLPPWRSGHELLLAEKPRLLVGLDFDYVSLRNHRAIKHLIRGDISNLPFPDKTFDLVTSNMVFEHLTDPETQLKEIFRVLKGNGILIFHTPNSLGYGAVLARLLPEILKAKIIWFMQKRNEEDVFKTHYKINTENTIKKISKNVGFNISKIHLIVSSALFVMIPPLVIFELFLIRLLKMQFARRFRTNIIAVLTKPM